ncbi:MULTISPECIES: hypothetical protein [Cryobacterium]|uniref:Histidine kinase n=1 Tax=Cryobacterium breve TaxID=1259258 RepID=A0ABY2JCX5_9MICO|nr:MULTISPECIES: hypothetical protein [Cryobacterium]TFC90437.1 hypothetical protein E3T20_16535 [Cryobacterium sp. TmT3-12]TFD01854.1 hypothetical protein E3O65_00730 [Cryobacterium breve]
MITVPRGLVLSLAAMFSAYHVVLGFYSLGQPRTPLPAILAIIVYAIATVVSLWPTSPIRMPVWLAFFNVAVCAMLPLLVGSQLDGSVDNGYATWYVAAVGTLMTVTATRRRSGLAWVGAAILVAHTIFWAGPAALGSMGVIGSVVWVAVAVILARALAKAGRDARQYALAEQEATEWQAAQEAHLYERQVRLAQTIRLAAPMLRRIIDQHGELNAEQRQESRYLEAAVRDEIRGRKLLNDAVRDAVMAARRRGAIVTLLDEGSIDDIRGAELESVLNALAVAIGGTLADTIIARTAGDGSATAVTVVGLSSADARLSALGQESPEPEVDLWLEIPRNPALVSSVPN